MGVSAKVCSCNHDQRRDNHPACFLFLFLFSRIHHIVSECGDRGAASGLRLKRVQFFSSHCFDNASRPHWTSHPLFCCIIPMTMAEKSAPTALRVITSLGQVPKATRRKSHLTGDGRVPRTAHSRCLSPDRDRPTRIVRHPNARLAGFQCSQSEGDRYPG